MERLTQERKKEKTLGYRAIPPYHSGIDLLLRFEDALDTFALKPSRGDEGNPTNPSLIDRPRINDGDGAGDRVAGDGVAGDGVTGDGVAGDRVAEEGVVGASKLGSVTVTA